MAEFSSSLLRLATRGSALAVAQANWVARRVEALNPGVRVDLVTITTSGDRIQDRPLHEAGGKGLFTKEVELALLEGRADFAVHSFKDVPVTMPLVAEAQTALVIAAVPERASVCDVLLSTGAGSIEALPAGARVGTTSLRRRALLLEVRPDLRVESLRGNIDTRLARLGAGGAGGKFDAILLARAGLSRLGVDLEGLVAVDLEPSRFVPAAGQGALAIQCRADDASTRRWLALLDHEPTRRCVESERAVVLGLNGDCTSPIGAWATPAAEGVSLCAAWHDGRSLRRAHADGPAAAGSVVRAFRGEQT